MGSNEALGAYQSEDEALDKPAVSSNEALGASYQSEDEALDRPAVGASYQSEEEVLDRTAVGSREAQGTTRKPGTEKIFYFNSLLEERIYQSEPCPCTQLQPTVRKIIIF